MYEYLVRQLSNEATVAHNQRIEEMREWCYGRFVKWGRASNLFWFSREEDYAMFLLRWS